METCSESAVNLMECISSPEQFSTTETGQLFDTMNSNVQQLYATVYID